MFTKPEEALEFAEAGGQVSLAEWKDLGFGARAALRAAAEIIRQRQALHIARALQGRLTAEQKRERDLAQLRDATAAVVR